MLACFGKKTPKQSIKTTSVNKPKINKNVKQNKIGTEPNKRNSLKPSRSKTTTSQNDLIVNGTKISQKTPVTHDKSKQTPQKSLQINRLNNNSTVSSPTKSTYIVDKTVISFYVGELYPGLRQELHDTINYRKDPKITSQNCFDLDDNLRFYKNEIVSRPEGDYIENILKTWWGEYSRLESHHGYIQWLFPIRTPGVNSELHELQLHELESLKKLPEVERRMIKAYKLMLDFYGMQLKDVKTGQIENTPNYKERYSNLKSRRHNFLRITRILKCLGDFELETFQIKFLEFLIDEIFVSKKLASLDVSITNYWIHTVKNDQKRNQLIERIEQIVFEKMTK